jgi:TolA-binding protein
LGVDDRAKFFVKDIDDILNNSVQRRDVAERLLQIALEFTNEGDRAQATNWLAHVVRVYPTTEAAVKASQLLESMP